MEQNANQTQYNHDYDEIDLRDILKTLGKGKKTIISVTLVFMLLSGILSCFIITPIYESKAVVIPVPTSQLGLSSSQAYIVTEQDFGNISDSKKIKDNLDNVIRLSQVDYTRYKELMTSDYVLNNTIKGLKMDSSPSKLRKNIKVEPRKEGSVVTDVLEITVQNPNPKLAAQITNLLIKETGNYINKYNNNNMDKLAQTLEIQLTAAQDDLTGAITQLENCKRQADVNQGNQPVVMQSQVEEKRLQNEVERRQDIVDSFNSKLLELKVQQALYKSEGRILVLSAAVVPESPATPNKILNMIVAGVLGAIVAIIGVFLVEYLRNEEKEAAA